LSLVRLLTNRRPTDARCHGPVLGITFAVTAGRNFYLHKLKSLLQFVERGFGAPAVLADAFGNVEGIEAAYATTVPLT
jgi:hypothetical protein